MRDVTRRSAIRGARPPSSEERDVVCRNVVDGYRKACGNTIDYSIIAFAPKRQKPVLAITSGAVPNVFLTTPTEDYVLFAWKSREAAIKPLLYPSAA